MKREKSCIKAETDLRKKETRKELDFLFFILFYYVQSKIEAVWVRSAWEKASNRHVTIYNSIVLDSFPFKLLY